MDDKHELDEEVMGASERIFTFFNLGEGSTVGGAQCGFLFMVFVNCLDMLLSNYVHLIKGFVTQDSMQEALEDLIKKVRA